MITKNGSPQATDVIIQSQVEPVFRYFMINEIKADITLTSPISEGDTVISVSSGHGFQGVGVSPGELLTIWNTHRYMQVEVLSVATDDLTIAAPAAAGFAISNSIVIRGNKNLAVNGSVTPVMYQLNMHSSIVPVDISHVGIHIKSAAAMDENTFGGITAITNGVYMRREGSLVYNFGNYKKNSDFRDAGADIEYPDKAPAGTYAISAMFDLKKVYTKEVRFNPRNSDILKAVVRDNNTNSEMHIILFGSYTTGE